MIFKFISTILSTLQCVIICNITMQNWIFIIWMKYDPRWFVAVPICIYLIILKLITNLHRLHSLLHIYITGMLLMSRWSRSVRGSASLRCRRAPWRRGLWARTRRDWLLGGDRSCRLARSARRRTGIVTASAGPTTPPSSSSRLGHA